MTNITQIAQEADIWKCPSIFPDFLEAKQRTKGRDSELSLPPEKVRLYVIDLLIQEFRPVEWLEAFHEYVARCEFRAASTLLSQQDLDKATAQVCQQKFEQAYLENKIKIDSAIDRAKNTINTIILQSPDANNDNFGMLRENLQNIEESYEDLQRFEKTLAEVGEIQQSLEGIIKRQSDEIQKEIQKEQLGFEGEGGRDRDSRLKKLILQALSLAVEYLAKGELKQSEQRLELAKNLKNEQLSDFIEIERDLFAEFSQLPERAKSFSREDNFTIDEVARWLRDSSKKIKDKIHRLSPKHGSWLESWCPPRLDESAQARRLLLAFSQGVRANDSRKVETLTSFVGKFCSFYGIEQPNNSKLTQFDHNQDILLTKIHLPDPIFFPALSRDQNPKGISLLLLTRENITPERVMGVLERAGISQKACWLIPIKSPRRDWRLRFSNKGVPLIIIDSNILIKTAGAGTEQRYRQLMMEVIPQFPLEFICPYKVQGTVPREMFFGRNPELQLLLSEQAPTILYGGRKLGKSSLLKRLAEEYNSIPDRVAVYIDIWAVRSPQSAFEMCRRLMGMLQNKFPGIQNSEDLTLSGFRNEITGLLEEDKNRRILCLIDEADAFFRIDQEQKYEICGTLRSLQIESNNRIRFLFAGFEDIHRASARPDSPFFNFNGQSPKPITPLSRSAARDLLLMPLTYMGYDFEDEKSLVDRILMYTASHPSLIQFYCRQLATQLHERKVRGSRIKIRGVDVDGIYLTQEFRKHALDTLKLNLEVSDNRLKYLFYRILFQHRENSTNTFQTLFFNQNDVYEWCIEEKIIAFKDAGEVQLLLEELTSLGLLKIGRRGFYLQNSSIVQLMEEFEDVSMTVLRLGTELEKPVLEDTGLHSQFLTLKRVDEERILTSTRQSFFALSGPRGGKSELIDIFREIGIGNKDTANRPVISVSLEDGLKPLWKALAQEIDSPHEVATTVRSHVHYSVIEGKINRIVVLLEGLENFENPSLDSILTELATLVLDAQQKIQIVATGGLNVARAILRGNGSIATAFSPITLQRLHGDTFQEWRQQAQLTMSSGTEEQLLEVTGGYLGFLEAMQLKQGEEESEHRIVNVTDIDTISSIDDLLEHLVVGSRSESAGGVGARMVDDFAQMRSPLCLACARESFGQTEDIVLGVDEVEYLKEMYNIEESLEILENEARALRLIGFLGEKESSGSEILGVIRAKDPVLEFWAKISAGSSR
jgi:hypothetical protein